MQKPTSLKLKIVLQETDPPVWRTISIPSSMTLEDLHNAIQLAMGWKNTHLFSFEIRGASYENADDYECGFESDLGEVFSTEVELGKVLAGVKTFKYVYDFGDDWKHQIKVLSPRNLVPSETPVCLDGANAAPPEDCGGVGGFHNLKTILADKSHEEHEEFLAWTGEDYDPAAFSLSEANGFLKSAF